MFKQTIEKVKESRGKALSISVTQRKSDVKKGVVLVDNRKVIASNSTDEAGHDNFKKNDFFQSPIQLMKQGNQQEAISEKRQDLGKIQSPKFINKPDADDVDTAKDELEALRGKIEQAAEGKGLKTQSHNGNMHELKERFHNDYVYLTSQGRVDAGHAHRTKILLSAMILSKALEITKNRARQQRKEITEEIAQL